MNGNEATAIVWWQGMLGVAGGLLAVYLMLLILLWCYARKHPETLTMKDALRLLPDLLRLIRSFTADRSIPAGVRVRLVLVLRAVIRTWPRRISGYGAYGPCLRQVLCGKSRNVRVAWT